MKGFAFVVLCALVAVQGRHTGVAKSERSLASLGENPWVVHLRIAVSTSGYLNSCAGALISGRWVLTAAECVITSRFIWVRYGAVNVINPSLVTETSTVRLSDGFKLALVSLNRYVESSDNIAPVDLTYEADGETGKFCGYGVDETGENAGELLSCSDVADAEPTEFDLGAPLVDDGVLNGILARDEDGELAFVSVAPYLDWIIKETGVSPAEVPDSFARSVNFVN